MQSSSSGMQCEGCNRFFDFTRLQRHQQGCAGYRSRVETLLKHDPVAPAAKRRRRIGFPAIHTPMTSLPPSLRLPTPPPQRQRQSSPEHDQLLPFSQPSPPNLTADGRPIRSNRGVLPARFVDFVDIPPEGPAPLDLNEIERNSADIANIAPMPIVAEDPNEKVTRTQPNSFGILREYIGVLPIRDPEEHTCVEDLVAPQTPSLLSIHNTATDNSVNVYAPYPNKTAFLLDTWYWGKAAKSKADYLKLTEIVGADDFNPKDIQGINWTQIHSDTGNNTLSPYFNTSDGWREGSVDIEIPARRGDNQIYAVKNIWYKSLVAVIRSRFQSFKSLKYHYVPHRLLWKPDELAPEQEISGELYNSPAFMRAHQHLQASSPEPGCNLPRNIAAMMFWSDSTHLTDFGTASLWPIYLQFGNESKYARGKPSERSFIHIAYMPSVCLY
jgi:hypothetical protein